MICPFMSNAKEKVECSNECALYIDEKEPCSIYSLAITLDTTNKKLDDIDYDTRNK